MYVVIEILKDKNAIVATPWLLLIYIEGQVIIFPLLFLISLCFKYENKYGKVESIEKKEKEYQSSRQNSLNNARLYLLLLIVIVVILLLIGLVLLLISKK